MTIDFTPAATAAPRVKQIWSHGRTEASLIVRNGEQAILSLVIPIGLLVLGRFFIDTLGSFEVTVTSVFALAIWSTCFTSLAIATGFERRYNVLERLAATPLGTSGIGLGKAVGVALITVGQLAILGVVALGLGWRPAFDLLHLTVALIATVLAMGCFSGLALALAGTARPEVTLAVANLIYLVGLVAGGVMLPVASYPGWAQPVVSVLPTAALGEALRYGSPLSLLVLLIWCPLALWLARRVFRWTS